MNLGRTAPCALPMEVRDASQRVYRLALHVGAEAATFETPVPFEPDSPVTLTFFLPDGSGPFEIRGHARVLGEEAEGEGELGCLAVTFPDAPQSIKNPLGQYVRQRLGLSTM